jgi:hypothetical protein
MPEVFFSNKRKIFRIDDFKINEPIQIINSSNYFLSCMHRDNIVDFFNTDDNSNRQKWIIEKHENKQNIYYIKCAFNRYNNTQYLGCPNLNNQVFLYTSKNKYTEWKIINIENKFYEITYNGDKFNPKEVCMVVSRDSENIEWALPYNDIAIIYNIGDKIKLPFKNIINLENNGREGHTYLYHIINNYDNLTDRTIFTKGSYFEYNKTFLYGVDNYNELLKVQPLGLICTEKDNIPPNDILEKYETKTEYGLEYLIYKKINEIQFTYSELFSVVKKQINKHDISIYKNLISELTTIDDEDNTNNFILEKLCLYIFED